jgi:hypothetical protein
MASIITATTTSGLTQSADNSGVLQLASGTGNLVTVPSVTGTAMVSGNMPAFLAYQTTVQSIPNAVATKINFDTETFDTNNNFDTSNGRFIPTVAGYYQINLTISLQISGNALGMLYKNGSHYLGAVTTGIVAISNSLATQSCVVSMNGSTDYLEGYVYQGTGGAVNSNNDSRFMQFSGSLIRSA